MTKEHRPKYFDFNYMMIFSKTIEVAKRKLKIGMCLLMTLLALSLSATDYYVAKSGNDESLTQTSSPCQVKFSRLLLLMNNIQP